MKEREDAMQKSKTTIKDMSETSDAKYYEYKDIAYVYEHIQQFPLSGKVGLDRFLPLLPINEVVVELPGQVGDTPLQQAKKLGEHVGLSNLWIKHEETNPTGCLKDRESAVVISAAVEKGIDSVYVISSGNAALSTAAYANKAGIYCTCYVPEKTSQGKQDLIRLYGADIITIPGFYEDVYRKVVDMDPPGWNVTTGQNEIRIEGVKTISYELIEQFKKVPDVIVVPCGNGGALAGIWKGFVELKKLGKIEKLPQMVAVQVKGAAPFSVALAKKQDFVLLGDIEDSIAEGIVAQESYCSPKAIVALHDSHGYVIEVTDEEIKAALKTVIQLESFVTEPTSAAAYAALPKLQCESDAFVVAVNTGSGMKMLEEVVELTKGVNHD